MDSKNTAQRNSCRSLQKCAFRGCLGQVWNHEEIGKHFETLFILHAKENAAYLIE